MWNYITEGIPVISKLHFEIRLKTLWFRAYIDQHIGSWKIQNKWYLNNKWSPHHDFNSGMGKLHVYTTVTLIYFVNKTVLGTPRQYAHSTLDFSRLSLFQKKYIYSWLITDHSQHIFFIFIIHLHKALGKLFSDAVCMVKTKFIKRKSNLFMTNVLFSTFQNDW